MFSGAFFFGIQPSSLKCSFDVAEFPGRFYVVNMSSGLSTIAGWAELQELAKGLRSWAAPEGKKMQKERCKKAEACEKARVNAWSLL